MAQIYFVVAHELGLVKIGITENIDQRLSHLSSMSPARITLRCVIEDATPELEKRIHKVFEEDRDHGEWFRITPDLERFMKNPDEFNLDEYAEELDMEEMPKYLNLTEDGDYELNFGKHEGELLNEVIAKDYAYIDWMLWKADFPQCVQEIIAEYLDKCK